MKNLWRLVVASLAATSALLATGIAARAQNVSYDIVELGSSLPDDTFRARRINESNVVIGTYTARDGSAGPSILRPDGTVRKLAGIDPLSDVDVNDQGNAVYTMPYLSQDIFYYDAATDATTPLLPPGPTGQQEHATALDNAGTIYGYVSRSGGGEALGPFYIREGQYTSLGALLGVESTLENANQSGVVVGRLVRTGDDGEVIGEPYRYDVLRRRALNLGALVGRGTAYAINEASNVGGTRYDSSSTPSYGYVLIRWRVFDAFLPGATKSAVTGINDANEAVGYSNTGSGTSDRAILWRRGETIDLSALPEVVAAGWNLESANAINNGGVIACTANRAGVSRVVLLVPKAGSRE